MKVVGSQKIFPCLWFNNNAEEAVEFYTSIFNHSKIGAIVHHGKDSMAPEGTVLTITFQIEGQDFMALNGGPEFSFTHAISFVVNCNTQQEVDYYWDKLLVGGEEDQCGWLKDRFGVSWQIVPTVLEKMMMDKDPDKVQRVTKAMLNMIKLDIAALEDAFNSVD